MSISSHIPITTLTIIISEWNLTPPEIILKWWWSVSAILREVSSEGQVGVAGRGGLAQPVQGVGEALLLLPVQGRLLLLLVVTPPGVELSTNFRDISLCPEKA